LDDPRASAQVECVPGGRGGDDDRRPSGVRHLERLRRAGRHADVRGRDRERDRGSGERGGHRPITVNVIVAA